MASEPASSRSYRFGPRVQRGTIVGVRPGQAVITALGLVGAVGSLRATTGAGRIPVAAVVVLAAAAVAFWPVAGRTLDQWLPTAARFTSASLTGAHREVVDVANAPRRDRPPIGFASLSLRAVDCRGRSIGALADRSAGTLSAVISLGSHAFALLDERDRAQCIDRWSGLLSACASGAHAPYRLQWLERTVPDRAALLRQHVERSFRQPASPAQAAARASYTELVADQTRDVLRHELLFVVSVRAARHALAEHPSGIRPRADEERLVDAVLAVEARCRAVGLAVEGLLSPAGLRAAMRRAIATGRAGPDARSAVGAWPLAVNEEWSSLRTDGTWHATYWIAEWPRTAVASGFLLPMLLEEGTRRAVSVVMAPIAPARAVRAVEHARTEAVADREIRRRHGFALTARSSREQEAVLRREDELAGGHAAYRFSGYVTVSADDAQALERSCVRFEQSGALARLEVRRLYGNQLEAFGFTLPLGRGCR